MPLDIRYLQYCQPDNPFYAPPTAPKHTQNFDVSPLAAPGWETKEMHPWTSWFPSKWSPPRQGWKIHVSATPRNAEFILVVAAKY